MKFVIKLFGSIAMWMIAGWIFDNHAEIFSTPWWREIFLITVAYMVGLADGITDKK